MQYADKHGRTLFVAAGLGGKTFMTFHRSPTGNLKRFVAFGNALPPRNTRAAAQRDLDAYAEARGLRAVEVAS
jgi:hypothetical protein